MINVRLGQKLIREVDDFVKKTNYASRTEFIREAVRRALEETRKQLAMKILNENFGRGNGPKVTDERVRKAREEVSKEMMKKFDL